MENIFRKENSLEKLTDIAESLAYCNIIAIETLSSSLTSSITTTSSVDTISYCSVHSEANFPVFIKR
ncbi:hypothetical protein CHS0354_005370, partial [Potamilus streckersoni]